MDARREPQPNVHHLARLATPQTRGFAATLRADTDLSASLCHKPLTVMTPPRVLLRGLHLKSVLAQGWIIHG
jgi:hypothetical protein